MIIIGVMGFLCLALFDYLKLNNKRFYSIFSFLGFFLISADIIIVAYHYGSIEVSIGLILGSILALSFFMLLIYSLFVELSFKQTYLSHNQLTYTRGTYSLCRHPGVIWLFFALLFLSLALSTMVLLLLAIIYTLINILYVYWQEKFIFIHQFDDYHAYIERTPFLIPRLHKIKHKK